jgi:enolase-phosphatase E1
VSFLPPACVLTDIEGTIIPAGFAGAVLRPYARGELAAFIARRRDEPAVAAALDAVRRLVPGQDPQETLGHWMRGAVTPEPLVELQALLWSEGFERRALPRPVFADVGPALRRWTRAGVRVAAYSADPAPMQRQILAHAAEGDLTDLFAGFFDTRVGPKAEPDSFSRLAIALAAPPIEVLYLSASEAELDAAAAAGLRTCQILRDAARPGARHLAAADFAAAARRSGLPAAA